MVSTEHVVAERHGREVIDLAFVTSQVALDASLCLYDLITFGSLPLGLLLLLSAKGKYKVTKGNTAL